MSYALRTCTLAVLALGLSACGATGPDSSSSPTAQSTPRSETAGQAAWPAPTDVAQRVVAAGLDLGPMGMAEHYHPQLRVVVKGDEVLVPANIGVDPTTGAMSSLHTHEPDGTLHVEAKQAGERFTLGQFLTEWGVPLSARSLGDVAAGRGSVQVTSNGQRVTGDPRQLRLEPEQQIVVRVP